MKTALVIIGPTASGKTALALHLGQVFDGEIISLDSALVYRGMNVGTAKPTAEELASVRHHLVDIIEPWESFSAAQFRQECIRLVSELSKRGKLPIICGGSMMYYKALVEGLSPLPTTTPEVRALIASWAQEQGWPALHERLRQIDPVLYARLAVNDKQRISRALEVYQLTGRPMSSFFNDRSAPCPFTRAEIILLPEDDRQKLRAAIRRRFLSMLSQGLVDEVQRLKALPQLGLSCPSMRSVGYRQVWEYLEGAYDYDTMVEKAVIATARLAKHQMTWLRGTFLTAALPAVPRLVLRPDAGDLYAQAETFVSRLD